MSIPKSSRITPLLKGIAICVVFCFTFTTLASSAPILELPIHKNEIAISPLAALIEIPESLGTIKERFAPDFRDGSGEPAAIIHIQDAHANYEAQVNTKKILEHLKKEYGVDLVFLEGAVEKFDPEQIQFLKDPERAKKTADLLTRDGVISGAELFLLEERLAEQKRGQSPGGAVPFSTAYGVEDPKLYRDNLDTFQAVIEKKNLSGPFLSHVQAQIFKESSRRFNKKLQDFFKQWIFYQNTQSEWIRHIGFLHAYAREVLNLDLSDPANQWEWPQLLRFFKLQGLEKKINLEKARQDISKLDRWLARHGVPKRLILGVQRFDPLQKEKNQNPWKEETPRHFLEGLYHEMSPKGFSFKHYPYFSRLAGVTILQNELEAAELLGETNRLTKLLLRRLAIKKEERELLFLYRDSLLLEKLFSLELAREDSEQIRKRVKKIRPSVLIQRLQAVYPKVSANSPQSTDHRIFLKTTTVDLLFDHALAFYRTAMVREEVIFQKTLSKMKEFKKSKAVLITGGFHSEGLFSQFKEKDISYIEITPHLSDLTDNKTYQGIMTMQADFLTLRSNVQTYGPRILAPFGASHISRPRTDAWIMTAARDAYSDFVREYSGENFLNRFQDEFGNSPAAQKHGFQLMRSRDSLSVLIQDEQGRKDFVRHPKNRNEIFTISDRRLDFKPEGDNQPEWERRSELRSEEASKQDIKKRFNFTDKEWEGLNYLFENVFKSGLPQDPQDIVNALDDFVTPLRAGSEEIKLASRLLHKLLTHDPLLRLAENAIEEPEDTVDQTPDWISIFYRYKWLFAILFAGVALLGLMTEGFWLMKGKKSDAVPSTLTPVAVPSSRDVLLQPTGYLYERDFWDKNPVFKKKISDMPEKQGRDFPEVRAIFEFDPETMNVTKRHYDEMEVEMVVHDGGWVIAELVFDKTPGFPGFIERLSHTSKVEPGIRRLVVPLSWSGNNPDFRIVGIRFDMSKDIGTVDGVNPKPLKIEFGKLKLIPNENRSELRPEINISGTTLITGRSELRDGRVEILEAVRRDLTNLSRRLTKEELSDLPAAKQTLEEAFVALAENDAGRYLYQVSMLKNYLSSFLDSGITLNSWMRLKDFQEPEIIGVPLPGKKTREKKSLFQRREKLGAIVSEISRVVEAHLAEVERGPKADEEALKLWAVFIQKLDGILEKMFREVPEDSDKLEILIQVDKIWKSKGWEAVLGSLLQHVILVFKKYLTPKEYEETQRQVFALINQFPSREKRLWAWWIYLVASVYHLRNFGVHVEQAGNDSRALDNEIILDLLQNNFLPDFLAWTEENKQKLELKDPGAWEFREAMLWVLGLSLDLRIYDVKNTTYKPGELAVNQDGVYSYEGLFPNGNKDAFPQFFTPLAAQYQKVLPDLIREILDLKKQHEKENFSRYVYDGQAPSLKLTLPHVFVKISGKRQGLKPIAGLPRSDLEAMTPSALKVRPAAIDQNTVDPYEMLQKVFLGPDKPRPIYDFLAGEIDSHRVTPQIAREQTRKILSSILQGGALTQEPSSSGMLGKLAEIKKLLKVVEWSSDNPQQVSRAAITSALDLAPGQILEVFSRHYAFHYAAILGKNRAQPDRLALLFYPGEDPEGITLQTFRTEDIVQNRVSGHQFRRMIAPQSLNPIGSRAEVRSEEETYETLQRSFGYDIETEKLKLNEILSHFLSLVGPESEPAKKLQALWDETEYPWSAPNRSQRLDHFFRNLFDWPASEASSWPMLGRSLQIPLLERFLEEFVGEKTAELQRAEAIRRIEAGEGIKVSNARVKIEKRTHQIKVDISIAEKSRSYQLIFPKGAHWSIISTAYRFRFPWLWKPVEQDQLIGHSKNHINIFNFSSGWELTFFDWKAGLFISVSINQEQEKVDAAYIPIADIGISANKIANRRSEMRVGTGEIIGYLNQLKQETLPEQERVRSALQALILHIEKFKEKENLTQEQVSFLKDYTHLVIFGKGFQGYLRQKARNLAVRLETRRIFQFFIPRLRRFAFSHLPVLHNALTELDDMMVLEKIDFNSLPLGWEWFVEDILNRYHGTTIQAAWQLMAKNSENEDKFLEELESLFNDPDEEVRLLVTELDDQQLSFEKKMNLLAAAIFVRARQGQSRSEVRAARLGLNDPQSLNPIGSRAEIRNIDQETENNEYDPAQVSLRKEFARDLLLKIPQDLGGVSQIELHIPEKKVILRRKESVDGKREISFSFDRRYDFLFRVMKNDKIQTVFFPVPLIASWTSDLSSEKKGLEEMTVAVEDIATWAIYGAAYRFRTRIGIPWRLVEDRASEDKGVVLKVETWNPDAHAALIHPRIKSPALKPGEIQKDAAIFLNQDLSIPGFASPNLFFIGLSQYPIAKGEVEEPAAVGMPKFMISIQDPDIIFFSEKEWQESIRQGRPHSQVVQSKKEDIQKKKKKNYGRILYAKIAPGKGALIAYHSKKNEVLKIQWVGEARNQGEKILRITGPEKFVRSIEYVTPSILRHFDKRSEIRSHSVAALTTALKSFNSIDRKKALQTLGHWTVYKEKEKAALSALLKTRFQNSLHVQVITALEEIGLDGKDAIKSLSDLAVQDRDSKIRDLADQVLDKMILLEKQVISALILVLKDKEKLSEYQDLIRGFERILSEIFDFSAALKKSQKSSNEEINLKTAVVIAKLTKIDSRTEVRRETFVSRTSKNLGTGRSEVRRGPNSGIVFWQRAGQILIAGSLIYSLLNEQFWNALGAFLPVIAESLMLVGLTIGIGRFLQSQPRMNSTPNFKTIFQQTIRNGLIGAAFVFAAFIFFHVIPQMNFDAIYQIPDIMLSVGLRFFSVFTGIFLSKMIFAANPSQSLQEKLGVALSWAISVSMISGYALYFIYIPFIGTHLSGNFLKVAFDIGIGSWLTIVPIEIAVGSTFGEKKDLIRHGQWKEKIKGSFSLAPFLALPLAVILTVGWFSSSGIVQFKITDSVLKIGYMMILSYAITQKLLKKEDQISAGGIQDADASKAQFSEADSEGRVKRSELRTTLQDVLQQKGIRVDQFTTVIYPASGNYDGTLLAMLKSKAFSQIQNYHLISLSYKESESAGASVKNRILDQLGSQDSAQVHLYPEDYYKARLELSSEGKRIWIDKGPGWNGEMRQEKLYQMAVEKGHIRPGDLVLTVPMGIKPYRWKNEIASGVQIWEHDYWNNWRVSIVTEEDITAIRSLKNVYPVRAEVRPEINISGTPLRTRRSELRSGEDEAKKKGRGINRRRVLWILGGIAAVGSAGWLFYPEPSEDEMAAASAADQFKGIFSYMKEHPGEPLGEDHIFDAAAWVLQGYLFSGERWPKGNGHFFFTPAPVPELPRDWVDRLTNRLLRKRLLDPKRPSSHFIREQPYLLLLDAMTALSYVDPRTYWDHKLEMARFDILSWKKEQDPLLGRFNTAQEMLEFLAGPPEKVTSEFANEVHLYASHLYLYSNFQDWFDALEDIQSKTGSLPDKKLWLTFLSKEPERQAVTPRAYFRVENEPEIDIFGEERLRLSPPASLKFVKDLTKDIQNLVLDPSRSEDYRKIQERVKGYFAAHEINFKPLAEMPELRSKFEGWMRSFHEVIETIAGSEPLQRKLAETENTTTYEWNDKKGERLVVRWNQGPQIHIEGKNLTGLPVLYEQGVLGGFSPLQIPYRDEKDFKDISARLNRLLFEKLKLGQDSFLAVEINQLSQRHSSYVVRIGDRRIESFSGELSGDLEKYFDLKGITFKPRDLDNQETVRQVIEIALSDRFRSEVREARMGLSDPQSLNPIGSRAEIRTEIHRREFLYLAGFSSAGLLGWNADLVAKETGKEIRLAIRDFLRTYVPELHQGKKTDSLLKKADAVHPNLRAGLEEMLSSRGLETSEGRANLKNLIPLGFAVSLNPPEVYEIKRAIRQNFRALPQPYNRRAHHDYGYAVELEQIFRDPSKSRKGLFNPRGEDNLRGFTTGNFGGGITPVAFSFYRDPRSRAKILDDEEFKALNPKDKEDISARIASNYILFHEARHVLDENLSAYKNRPENGLAELERAATVSEFFAPLVDGRFYYRTALEKLWKNTLYASAWDPKIEKWYAAGSKEILRQMAGIAGIKAGGAKEDSGIYRTIVEALKLKDPLLVENSFFKAWEKYWEPAGYGPPLTSDWYHRHTGLLEWDKIENSGIEATAEYFSREPRKSELAQPEQEKGPGRSELRPEIDISGTPLRTGRSELRTTQGSFWPAELPAGWSVRAPGNEQEAKAAFEIFKQNQWEPLDPKAGPGIYTRLLIDPQGKVAGAYQVFWIENEFEMESVARQETELRKAVLLKSGKFAVDQSLQGKGLGKAFFDRIKDEWLRQGIGILIGNAIEENALDFWEGKAGGRLFKNPDFEIHGIDSELVQASYKVEERETKNIKKRKTYYQRVFDLKPVTTRMTDAEFANALDEYEQMPETTRTKQSLALRIVYENVFTLDDFISLINRTRASPVLQDIPQNKVVRILAALAKMDEELRQKLQQYSAKILEQQDQMGREWAQYYLALLRKVQTSEQPRRAEMREARMGLSDPQSLNPIGSRAEIRAAASAGFAHHFRAKSIVQHYDKVFLRGPAYKWQRGDTSNDIPIVIDAKEDLAQARRIEKLEVAIAYLRRQGVRLKDPAMIQRARHLAESTTILGLDMPTHLLFYDVRARRGRVYHLDRRRSVIYFPLRFLDSRELDLSGLEEIAVYLDRAQRWLDAYQGFIRDQTPASGIYAKMREAEKNFPEIDQKIMSGRDPKSLLVRISNLRALDEKIQEKKIFPEIAKLRRETSALNDQLEKKRKSKRLPDRGEYAELADLYGRLAHLQENVGRHDDAIQSYRLQVASLHNLQKVDNGWLPFDKQEKIIMILLLAGLHEEFLQELRVFLTGEGWPRKLGAVNRRLATSEWKRFFPQYIQYISGGKEQLKADYLFILRSQKEEAQPRGEQPRIQEYINGVKRLFPDTKTKFVTPAPAESSGNDQAPDSKGPSRSEVRRETFVSRTGKNLEYQNPMVLVQEDSSKLDVLNLAGRSEARNDRPIEAKELERIKKLLTDLSAPVTEEDWKSLEGYTVNQLALLGIQIHQKEREMTLPAAKEILGQRLIRLNSVIRKMNQEHPLRRSVPREPDHSSGSGYGPEQSRRAEVRTGMELISAEDRELLQREHIPWKKLQRQTQAFLIRELFREVHLQEPDRHGLTRLTQKDFREKKLNVLGGKTLSGLYANYERSKNKPEKESALSFMFRSVGLAELKPEIEKIESIQKFAERIKRGDLSRGKKETRQLGWGVWERLSEKLQRELVEALARQTGKKVLDLNRADFSVRLNSIGFSLTGLIRLYDRRARKEKRLKTSRWLLLETIGYLPKDLPDLTAIQTGEDLKPFLDTTAVTVVPWGALQKRNIRLLQHLVKELAATVFHGGATPELVEKVTDADLQKLTSEHFRHVVLPGLGRTLASFYDYFEKSTPVGKITARHILESIDLARTTLPLVETYGLGAVRALQKNGVLTLGSLNRMWFDLPQGAQRELLSELASTLNKPLNQLTAKELIKTKIPSLGRSLAGLYNHYQQDAKRPRTMPILQYLLNALGFVRTPEVFEVRVEEILKSFRVYESLKNSRPFFITEKKSYAVLNPQRPDFDNLSLPLLRHELNAALLHVSRNLQQEKDPALEDWKKGLEAYQALLDTAEWMPEIFEQVVKAIPTSTVSQLPQRLASLVEESSFHSRLLRLIEDYEQRKTNQSWMKLQEMGWQNPKKFLEMINSYFKSPDQNLRDVIHSFLRNIAVRSLIAEFEHLVNEKRNGDHQFINGESGELARLETPSIGLERRTTQSLNWLASRAEVRGDNNAMQVAALLKKIEEIRPRILELHESFESEASHRAVALKKHGQEVLRAFQDYEDRTDKNYDGNDLSVDPVYDVMGNWIMSIRIFTEIGTPDAPKQLVPLWKGLFQQADALKLMLDHGLLGDIKKFHSGSQGFDIPRLKETILADKPVPANGRAGKPRDRNSMTPLTEDDFKQIKPKPSEPFKMAFYDLYFDLVNLKEKPPDLGSIRIYQQSGSLKTAYSSYLAMTGHVIRESVRNGKKFDLKMVSSRVEELLGLAISDFEDGVGRQDARYKALKTLSLNAPAVVRILTKKYREQARTEESSARSELRTPQSLNLIGSRGEVREKSIDELGVKSAELEIKSPESFSPATRGAGPSWISTQSRRGLEKGPHTVSSFRFGDSWDRIVDERKPLGKIKNYNIIKYKSYMDWRAAIQVARITEKIVDTARVLTQRELRRFEKVLGFKQAFAADQGIAIRARTLQTKQILSIDLAERLGIKETIQGDSSALNFNEEELRGNSEFISALTQRLDEKTHFFIRLKGSAQDAAVTVKPLQKRFGPNQVHLVSDSKELFKSVPWLNSRIFSSMLGLTFSDFKIAPEIFTAEEAPGLPGVSGAVPVRGDRPRAGGRAKRGPLTGRKGITLKLDLDERSRALGFNEKKILMASIPLLILLRQVPDDKLDAVLNQLGLTLHAGGEIRVGFSYLATLSRLAAEQQTKEVSLRSA